MRDNDDGPKRTGKKAVPRRKALKASLGVIGGLVTIAAAGAAGRLWQTGAGGNLTGGPAFAPWRDWESGSAKGMEGIVAAAILAPSAHNTQPWKFTIADNVIDLHADTARTIGALDPAGREMTMSLGCVVENMVIGAQAMGFTPVLNLLPAGPEGDHIARLTVFAGEHSVPLEATALTRRHTHRGPYLREQKVATEVVDTLYAQTGRNSSRLVWLGADSNNGKAFSQGTLEAAHAIIADNELARDHFAWFRPDLATANRLGDGLTISTAGLTPLMTRVALTAPGQIVAQQLPERWLTQTRDVQLATAPLFGLITVPDLSDRAALLEAGRLWQRLHLTGTLKNLAMQPLNQMMEIADRDRALQRPSKTGQTLAELSGFADSTVAFGFRLGYAAMPSSPSPRRGVKQVIIT